MPVYNTNSTSEQPRAQAESRVKLSEPAAALVYRGGNAQDFVGLRIESQALSVAFVSNISFSRDPLGDLYYRDVRDLADDCSYDIYFKVGEVLSVTFYGDDPNSPFAQFVSRDLASALGWLSYYVGNTSVQTQGTWQSYIVVNIVAKLFCRSRETSAEIDLTPIEKTVKFSLPFKALSTIIQSRRHPQPQVPQERFNGHKDIVDYNADRILFYPQTGKSEMTAYFIPREEGGASFEGQQFISDSPTATWSVL
ncbi:hypothetical protein M422DRAFT_261469 [Sphaerobolus stellatus SS14]|uniref:Uncharacterized protein n=1 Tax=Sphaerobolus stellatus (strain SS14) TaxID=990650 RepID=A0A0C9V322_SPHS4|nr:hypothetical protein M422DRAFT_261469 [Sphaerobolus stellatus SS14]